MGITFSCPSCGRRMTVEQRLAGKQGKCRSCGGPIRVPEPTPAGPAATDIYGLDDEPTAPARGKWSSAVAAAEAPSPLPWRAGSRGAGNSKREKDGESWHWAKWARQVACGSMFLGLVLIRKFPAHRLAEIGMHPVATLVSFVTMTLLGVGVLLTVISLVVGLVLSMTGNTRVFATDTKGDRIAWVCACIMSAIIIGGAGYGLTHPSAARPQGPQPGNAFLGGPPAAAGGPAAGPPFGPGSEVQSDVRVTLSNGRFMRNTSPIGTARPGVGISVDYQIDGGGLFGPERFVLVIASARGRGELDDLHEMRMRRSGTIHASSFMASPEEGPYQAWVEVATMPGPLGRRKQVSSPTTLQFTDVPVRDPAAEARAAMEEQQRQMMTPPRMPPIGPGFPPPGPMAPMGPRGPRGGHFGPRPQ